MAGYLSAVIAAAAAPAAIASAAILLYTVCSIFQPIVLHTQQGACLLLNSSPQLFALLDCYSQVFLRALLAIFAALVSSVYIIVLCSTCILLALVVSSFCMEYFVKYYSFNKIFL